LIYSKQCGLRLQDERKLEVRCEQLTAFISPLETSSLYLITVSIRTVNNYMAGKTANLY